MERPRTWTELIEQLYEGAWNADLRRFRSPYAFRGLSCASHTLTTSLVRLAGGKVDLGLLEQSLLRNFRKYLLNERTLFPGLDGLSRWLERYYRPAGKE